jgi:hypothetical protein
MTRSKGRRTRVFSLVAVALGAMAIFVLPSLASARHSSDDDGSASATIKSFDPATRILVIALPGEQTISGTVSSRTKIRCEDQSRSSRDDNRVRGREAEPGDDRGGHGNEAGDDNGGEGSGPSNSGSGSGGHDDNGSGANCTTADLVAGAAVEEIELKFRSSGVVYDEVELDD